MRFPFRRTLAVAHRGAHDHAHPENSLAAFERALELGVEAVELDACNLADGSLVVRHDAWLEVGSERVALPTLMPGDPIAIAADLPPLEPYLQLLGAANVLVVFDWKGLGAEPAAAALLELHGLVERTLVSTSVADALATFRSADSRLATGLTMPLLSKRMPPPPVVVKLARQARADAVVLDKDFVTPATAAADDSSVRSGSARATVAANRDSVERVANTLIQRREMHGDEVVDLLNNVGLVRPKIDLLDDHTWPPV